MENYSYNSYAESGDSSPRSREIDFENPSPWEDSQGNQPPPNYKVKFMCSYGGKIHPRPHDNQLSYMGGETKILSVDRNIKFGSLLAKLISLCESDNISFKYQLPGEDLDALISVTNDDDLEHMMHEYERLYRISPKPARLRIFIFQTLNQSLSSSTRSFGSDEGRSEKERFVEALNSAPIITAPPSVSPAAPQPQPQVSSVDFLFGLEKGNALAAQAALQHPVVGRVPEVEDPVYVPNSDERFMGLDPIQKHIQDLQRLKLEEQQVIQRRKSDQNFSGGFTGGEYYKAPEKAPSPAIQGGGVAYWSDKQVPGGVIPASTGSNEQAVYMIQTPTGTYHAPMVRPMGGPPAQGFYTVQRMQSDMQNQQQLQSQQQMYNVIPQSLQQQKPTGYSEGYGMVRPGTGGGVGMVADTGYGQVAYDGGVVGRQVYYTTAGGVMSAPPQVQAAAQYQAMVGGVTTDMRPAGALNPEAASKGVQKVSQASL
ncbi:hypothetical protein ACS0TY_002872 [Phlomoides rotata]